jgi:hypothetical protein
MKLSAEITHTAPGRIRFKVPAKRHDPSFFEELQIDCSGFDGVKQVTTNVLTGSVLLLYDDIKQDALIERIKNHPLLDFPSKNRQAGKSGPASATADQQTAAQKASSSLASFDSTLQEFSNGFLDLRSVLFISFVMFAARQLAQGAVFGSAINLFWYALQLIRPKKP